MCFKRLDHGHDAQGAPAAFHVPRGLKLNKSGPLDAAATQAAAEDLQRRLDQFPAVEQAITVEIRAGLDGALPVCACGFCGLLGRQTASL